MARQLKTTDSAATPFGVKYGNGSAGDKTYSSNTVLSSTDGFYVSRVTGTSGATTGIVADLADGTYNLPCKLMQSTLGGSTATPNWEYNFLISVSGGVATFKYPLTITFIAGAQIITSNQWRNVIINNGVQLSAPAWDGVKGGELFLAASVSITGQSNNGQIVMDGLGFRGGAGTGNNNPGFTGESDTSPSVQTTAAQGNGAGGGGGATDGGHVEGGNGGGGGNAGSGTSGNARNTGTGGAAGAGASSSDLRTMVMGGGGSGGGGGWSDGTNSSAGTNGAGNAQLLSPTITGIVFYCRGQNGNSNSTRAASGAGAGGDALCQGQNVSQITFNIGGGTGGVCTGSFGGNGGNGAPGYAQIDYAGAPPSGITGTYSSTLTPVLGNNGGGILAML